MKKTYIIYCVDNNMEYHYTAINTLEAMKSHIYYLSLSNELNINDIEELIVEGSKGLHLTFNDLTYWIRKD